VSCLAPADTGATAIHIGPLLLELDLSSWRTWVILVAGLAAAALVFLGGRFLFMHLWRQPPKALTPRPHRPLASDPKERRTSRRRGGKLKGMIFVRADTAEAPARALLVDRSSGGIRLSVPEAIGPGALLNIRNTSASLETPWVQVEVVHCQAVGSGWEIGCRFTEPPPKGTLF